MDFRDFEHMVALDDMTPKARKIYAASYAIDFSRQRNALVGVLEVVTKKDMIPDSTFTLEIKASIEELEGKIMVCYREATKDDESESES